MVVVLVETVRGRSGERGRGGRTDRVPADLGARPLQPSHTCLSASCMTLPGKEGGGWGDLERGGGGEGPIRCLLIWGRTSHSRPKLASCLHTSCATPPRERGRSWGGGVERGGGDRGKGEGGRTVRCLLIWGRAPYSRPTLASCLTPPGKEGGVGGWEEMGRGKSGKGEGGGPVQCLGTGVSQPFHTNVVSPSVVCDSTRERRSWGGGKREGGGVRCLLTWGRAPTLQPSHANVVSPSIVCD